jgi:Mg-chelatase subunit ChlD
MKKNIKKVVKNKVIQVTKIKELAMTKSIVHVIYTTNGSCEDTAEFDTRAEANSWIAEQEASGENFMVISVELTGAAAAFNRIFG